MIPFLHMCEREALPFNRQPLKLVKHTQRIDLQQPSNYFSVFDQFVGLELKGLKAIQTLLTKVFGEKCNALVFTVLAMLINFKFCHSIMKIMDNNEHFSPKHSHYWINQAQRYFFKQRFDAVLNRRLYSFKDTA